MKDFKKHEVRLLDRLSVNERTSLLTFVVERSYTKDGVLAPPADRGVSFDARGGQYVILETGFEGSDGKPLKRAYSLLPPQVSLERMKALDPDLRVDPWELFTLAVFQVGDKAPVQPGFATQEQQAGAEEVSAPPYGSGSRALSQAGRGQLFKLSGPWGRLTHEHPGELVKEAEPLFPAPAKKMPRRMKKKWAKKVAALQAEILPAPTTGLEAMEVCTKRLLLVVAVGSGITGGLHLFSDRDTAESYGGSHLLWIDDGRFLPQGMVREILALCVKDLGDVPHISLEQGNPLTHIPTQGDLTVLSYCDEVRVRETMERVFQNLVAAAISSQDAEEGEQVLVDVAFFGDGSLFPPLVAELDRLVITHRHF